MNQQINLIAFGTFGNPSGFRQTFFIGEEQLAKKVKTFDLKTDAIKLFPNTKIYSIRKDYINGYNSVAYCIYTFAKEQNSDRGGTFVGSSILFLDRIADEHLTIACLNDFHANLVEKNVQDQVICVDHSDKFTVNMPNSFNKLPHNLREIGELNCVSYSNKNLVVYCSVDIDGLKKLYKKAIDLLNVYDTIYFTDSAEIAEFVYQKKLFLVANMDGFQNEILALQQERVKRVAIAIAKFENEKQKLEEDRKKVIDSLTKQIEINTNQHKENQKKIDESITQVNITNEKYNSYDSTINQAIGFLKSGKKLDEVVDFNYKNKQIFVESVNNQTSANFISAISTPKAKTEIKPNVLHLNNPQPKIPNNNFVNNQAAELNDERGEYRIDFFKVATAGLLILWVATLMYFLNTPPAEPPVAPPIADKTTNVSPPSASEQAIVKPLDPKPNSKLNEQDTRTVYDNINTNMSIDAVTDIIFMHNPTEVSSKYSLQKEAYKEALFELNSDCFQRNEKGIYILSQKKMMSIPCYDESDNNR